MQSRAQGCKKIVLAGFGCFLNMNIVPILQISLCHNLMIMDIDPVQCSPFGVTDGNKECLYLNNTRLVRPR